MKMTPYRQHGRKRRIKHWNVDEKVLNTVHYPSKDSEFNVQANLWKRLTFHGLDVQGNVSAFCRDFDRVHRVFFDLVVFDKSKKPLLIIECKNSLHDGTYQLNPKSRQARRYAIFGLPMIKCPNYEEIEPVVTKVFSFLNNGILP